ADQLQLERDVLSEPGAVAHPVGADEVERDDVAAVAGADANEPLAGDDVDLPAEAEPLDAVADLLQRDRGAQVPRERRERGRRRAHEGAECSLPGRHDGRAPASSKTTAVCRSSFSDGGMSRTNVVKPSAM